MKLTCNRDALLTACQAIGVAVAPKNTGKAVLCNVKASPVKDVPDAVSLAATDLEVGIRYTIPGVRLDDPSPAILPFGMLVQILREHPDVDDVAIDATDREVTVRVGMSKYELLSYPVDEFPDVPECKSDRWHEVASPDLRVMLHQAGFATDRKDASGARFALTAVLWDPDQDKAVARVIATDSKRLAACQCPATFYGEAGGMKPANHLIPAKAVTLLDRNLSDDGGPVSVTLGATEMMFQTGNAMIHTRLIEGRYPPWKDIISKTMKEAKHAIALPTALFLAKVRQAAIATDEESKRVDMVFEPGRVSMTARGSGTDPAAMKGGKGSKKVSGSTSAVEMPLGGYDGPKIDVCFDPKYLTEFFRAAGGQAEVVLHISDGGKPVLFKAGPAYQYLVMPLTA